MKSRYLLSFAFFCLGNSLIFSTDIDSSFSIKWHNDSWGVGGLFPAGPPWNMVGPYDFDNDGFGDFVVSSSYAGQYCNGVYHYEAVSNDSIDISIFNLFDRRYSKSICDFFNYPKYIRFNKFRHPN